MGLLGFAHKYIVTLKILKELIRHNWYGVEEDEWSWLFYRVSDPDDYLFSDRDVLIYLVVEPLRLDWCVGVCDVYEKLKGHLYNNNMSYKIWATIIDCCYCIGKEYLVQEIYAEFVRSGWDLDRLKSTRSLQKD